MTPFHLATVLACLILTAGLASAQPYPVQVVIAQPDGGFIDAELKAAHADVLKALAEKKYASLFRIDDTAALQIRIVKTGAAKEDRTTDVLRPGLGTYRREAKHTTVTMHTTTLELVAGSASKSFDGQSTWSPAQAHKRAVEALAAWVKENAEALSGR